MAGVLLLISKNPENKKLLKQNSDILKEHIEKIYRPYFKKISYETPCSDSFLVIFHKDNTSKFFNDENGNWLAFEGNVLSLKDTISFNAEALLKLYLKRGSDFVNELDGQFVIKIYDKRTNEYLIINDFIKYKINYLAENQDQILFTPFVSTSSVIHKSEVDLYALNEFLWRYSYLSDRSIVKHVKRLAPARIYKVKEGKLSNKIYWHWPRKYKKIRFNEAVDRALSNIKDSIKQISMEFGKPCIDFTMGQDSRMIISTFNNLKLPYKTTTFGKKDFFEVRSVKEMSERHNIENDNILLGHNYFENLKAYFSKSIILGNCEEPGHLLGRIIFMREQQLKHSTTLINGADGQFYKNGLWVEMYTFNLFLEPSRVNIQLFLKLRVLSKKYHNDIFGQNFLKIKRNSKQYFTNLVNQGIGNYHKSPVAIQMDRFSMYYWTNFLNAANNAVSMFSDSFSPLLFRRNLELALEIPVKWKFNSSRFQRAIVYSLDPSMAKEKTDMGGINMVPKNIITYIPFFIKYSLFQLKRLTNKIKSIFGANIKTELQEAWDYKPVYRKLFEDPAIQSLLDYNNMILVDILEKNKWQDYLALFEDPEAVTLSDYEFIFKLASVEEIFKLMNYV